MHDLQACLFEYITVAAFTIYAQRGEDAAKRGGRRPCIKWKNRGIVFLNFCGNPVKTTGSDTETEHLHDPKPPILLNANNKVTDQPVHLCSLISTFVIH